MVFMAGVTVTDERLKVGKKIGTQRGTTGFIYCSDDYGDDNVIGFDDGATAVQNLLAGKVDCVVIDSVPAQEYVKANAGLTILDTEYTNEDYAIGLAKDNTALQEAPEQGAGRAQGGRHHPVHHRQVHSREVIAEKCKARKGRHTAALYVRRKKEVPLWVIGHSSMRI